MSTFSHVKSGSFLPKCPYAAVFVYIGLFRRNVSIMVDTFNTGKIDEEKIEAQVREIFDTTPLGIIETLRLKRPIYTKTAAYGHFGRNEPDFTWEKIDKSGSFKM